MTATSSEKDGGEDPQLGWALPRAGVRLDIKPGGRGSCSPQSDQSLLGKTPSHRDPGIWACRKGACGQAQGPPVGSPHSPFSVCPAELCLVPQQAHGWAAASTLDVTGGQDGQKGPPAPSRLLPRSRRTQEHPGRGTSPASAAASGASVHTCGSGSRFSQHHLSWASRPSLSCSHSFLWATLVPPHTWVCG